MRKRLGIIIITLFLLYQMMVTVWASEDKYDQFPLNLGHRIYMGRDISWFSGDNGFMYTESDWRAIGQSLVICI